MHDHEISKLTGWDLYSFSKCLRSAYYVTNPFCRETRPSTGARWSHGEPCGEQRQWEGEDQSLTGVVERENRSKGVSTVSMEHLRTAANENQRFGL